MVLTVTCRCTQEVWSIATVVLPELRSLLWFEIACAGNEGVGLRMNIKRACNELIKVQMSLGFRSPEAPDTEAQSQGSAKGLVDSLNVSVATGILLHDLLASARKQTIAG